jgi:hypothetical protein
MTMNVQPRYRLAIAIVASVGVVVVVLVAVLLAGGGVPLATPTPSTSASASTDPMSTPEGAVRAFFEAFAEARRTDDPALVEPLVTSKQSSAYLSVAGFLGGQKEVKKASVTTVLRIENVSVDTSGDNATVTFAYTEGGYDISLETGQALESPVVLPTVTVTAYLKHVDDRWLIDRYESSS